MKRDNKRIINKQKGITLIALVVTIIVLLILAGISISMLAGQNGILTKGKEAKEDTEVSNEMEILKLATQDVFINGYVSDNTTEESLKKSLEELIGLDENGNDNFEMIINDDETFTVGFKSGNYYLLDGKEVTKTSAPRKKIYFSFYSIAGTLRETLYAYEGQTWKDWQTEGTAGKQAACIRLCGGEVEMCARL